MHRTAKLWLLAPLAVVLSAGSVVSAAAVPRLAPPNPASPHRTWTGLGKLTLAQVSALQDPLVSAGTPVATLGQTNRWSWLYGGMALDTPARRVDLYVTDVARAGGLLSAARKADPGLDFRLIRVLRTRYSLAQYRAAASRLLSLSLRRRLPFQIYSVSMQVPADSLHVLVSHPIADQRLADRPLGRLGGRSLTGVAGASLTFVRGSAPSPANRQDDSRPFIGGDGLNSGGEDCTAGVAVENPHSHTDYLITAAHCFKDRARVSTYDDVHRVGKVTVIDKFDDAELISTGHCCGAGSRADEGERNKGANAIVHHPLVGNAPFMANEIIFQDGLSTFFARKGIQKLYTQAFNTWTIRGPNGEYTVSGYTSLPYTSARCTRRHPSGCGVIGGDSGAVVFIYNNGHRKAIGMVDAGDVGSDCDSSGTVYCVQMWFTYIYNIYKHTHTKLNPHT